MTVSKALSTAVNFKMLPLSCGDELSGWFERITPDMHIPDTIFGTAHPSDSIATIP